MRKRKDYSIIWLSGGAAVLTGLVYYLGKFTGRAEAYTHCSDMLKETAKEMTENMEALEQ